MRLLIAGLVATSVVIAAAAAPAFEFPGVPRAAWTWREAVDPVTDTVQRTALAVTTHLNVRGTRSTPTAGVLLTCADGAPSISFLWTTRVAGATDWTLEYRFAGQPGHRATAKYVNRGHLAGTSLADLQQFLAEAAVSDRLLVRVTSFAYGATEATFSTRGGREMVGRFLMACPVAGPSHHKE